MKHFKTLSSLVALILANGMMLAQDYNDNQGLNYLLDTATSTCVVTESPEAKGMVEIPESINVGGQDYNVNGLNSYAFYNNLYITEITLPSTIQVVQDMAVYGCFNLSKVNCLAQLPPQVSENSFSQMAPNVSLIVGYEVAPDYYSNVFLKNNFTFVIGKETDSFFSNGVNYNYVNDYFGYPNDTYVDIGDNNDATGDIIIPGQIFNGNKYYLLLGYTSGAFADSKITSIDLSRCSNMMDLGSGTFYNCTELESIILPSYLYSTSLPAELFANCSSLKAIDLTAWAGLGYIGDSAFQNCESLETVKLPSTLTNIAFNAFQGCGNIAEIYCEAIDPPYCADTAFNTSIYENCRLYVPEESEEAYREAGVWSEFVNIQALDIVNGFIYEGVQYYIIKGADHQVMVGNNNTYTGELDLPSEVPFNGETYVVTGLGADCFQQSQITSITLPSSVVNIPFSVFSDCTMLESADFSKSSISSLGEYCFFNCSNLKSVSLPSSLVSFIGDVFYGCENLESLTCLAKVPPSAQTFGDIVNTCTLYVPEGSVELYKAAENWKDFVNIRPIESSQIVVDGIKYEIISKNNFEVTVASDNSYTGNLNIPEQIVFDGDFYTVTELAENAFYLCDEITGITLPATINKVDANAFFACKNLTSVDLGDTSIVSIEDNTFLYCSALETVILPSTISQIGYKAFQGCGSIASLTCPAAVPPVCSDNAFDSSIYTTCKLKVPAESMDLYKEANVWMNFASLDFAGTFELDGVVYEIISDDEAMIVSGSTYEGNLILNDWVTYEGTQYKLVSIGPDAFANCETITGVTLPQSVATIGTNAFAGCINLSEANLGYSDIQIIEEGVFSGCAALTDVTLPFGLKYISSNVFKGCFALSLISCDALTPPSCEEDTFEEAIYVTCILNVPEGLAELYMNVPIWENFIISSGVNALCNITGNVEIYTLDGVKIFTGDIRNANIGKGIFVIKNNDKTIKIRK